MAAILATLSISGAIATTILLGVVGVAIRRRYLSALSDIPGPFLASFSLLWQLWQIVGRHTERAVIEQHKKHGE